MARNRGDAMFHLLEIADFNLCLLDEPIPATALNPDQPLVDQYTREHTRAWSEVVASFDGYVFVAPEYNRGISGALKNAIEFLFREWGNRLAAFIGYGATNGARAIEGLRLVMSAVQVGTVRPAVGLSLFTDFENGTAFRPAATGAVRLSPLTARRCLEWRRTTAEVGTDRSSRATSEPLAAALKGRSDARAVETAWNAGHGRQRPPILSR
jgi:NAD(P)H-dependent FMN reductase